MSKRIERLEEIKMCTVGSTIGAILGFVIGTSFYIWIWARRVRLEKEGKEGPDFIGCLAAIVFAALCAVGLWGVSTAL